MTVFRVLELEDEICKNALRSTQRELAWLRLASLLNQTLCHGWEDPPSSSSHYLFSFPVAVLARITGKLIFLLLPGNSQHVSGLLPCLLFQKQSILLIILTSSCSYLCKFFHYTAVVSHEDLSSLGSSHIMYRPGDGTHPMPQFPFV